MSPKLCCVEKTNNTWLLWQRPMRNRKTNFSLVIHSHSFTKHKHLAKIGPVDVEIIRLRENVKNKDETEAEQRERNCAKNCNK